MECLVTSLSLHFLPVKLGVEPNLASKSLPAFTFYDSKCSQTLNQSYKENLKQGKETENDQGSIRDATVREDLAGNLTLAEIEKNERVNMWLIQGKKSPVKIFLFLMMVLSAMCNKTRTFISIQIFHPCQKGTMKRSCWPKTGPKGAG